MYCIDVGCENISQSLRGVWRMYIIDIYYNIECILTADTCARDWVRKDDFSAS